LALAAATGPAAATATGAAAATATGAAAAATTSPATDEHCRDVLLSHGCHTIAESAAAAIRFKVKTGSVGV
jgi:cobalamin biosynthesis protein CbiG